MTRKEIVKVVGEEWVEAVEKENCECDCVVNNDNARDRWSATILFDHGHYVSFPNGEEYRGIQAVYYMDPELTTTKDPDEDIDLGSLDWEIDHYELLY